MTEQQKLMDDKELRRLIWEEWEGEIKKEDPRQMVFKYMKLMRESIISPLPHQDGASAEDVLKDVLGGSEWIGSMPIVEWSQGIKAMHQFAQSEVEKAVADKDMFIQRLYDQAKDREEYITYAKPELETKDREIEELKAEIALMIVYDNDKCITYDQMQSNLASAQSELSAANERIKDLEGSLRAKTCPECTPM